MHRLDSNSGKTQVQSQVEIFKFLADGKLEVKLEMNPSSNFSSPACARETNVETKPEREFLNVCVHLTATEKIVHSSKALLGRKLIAGHPEMTINVTSLLLSLFRFCIRKSGSSIQSPRVSGRSTFFSCVRNSFD
jgi:hypothetical protein